jgi:hypothetical protein
VRWPAHPAIMVGHRYRRTHAGAGLLRLAEIRMSTAVAKQRKPLLKHHRRGQPTRYDKTMVERAEKLSSLGYNLSELAVAFGVEPGTITLWKQTHKDFLKAIERGREASVSDVEVSLKKRAMGYSHPAVHFSNHNGIVSATPYIERYPPDTAAAKLYLTNRAPERWKDAQVAVPAPTVNVQINFDAVRERLRQRGAVIDVTPTPE